MPLLGGAVHAPSRLGPPLSMGAPSLPALILQSLDDLRVDRADLVSHLAIPVEERLARWRRQSQPPAGGFEALRVGGNPTDAGICLDPRQRLQRSEKPVGVAQPPVPESHARQGTGWRGPRTALGQGTDPRETASLARLASSSNTHHRCRSREAAGRGAVPGNRAREEWKVSSLQEWPGARCTPGCWANLRKRFSQMSKYNANSQGCGRKRIASTSFTRL